MTEPIDAMTTPLLPDYPRCTNNCGRLVWHHDTQLCAICDTKPRKGRPPKTRERETRQ